MIGEVTPSERDAVRVRVARLGVEHAIQKCDGLERCELDRLETEVALFDVRSDLAIALRHLGNAASALERIEASLWRRRRDS